jgi:hypothetical protein
MQNARRVFRERFMPLIKIVPFHQISLTEKEKKRKKLSQVEFKVFQILTRLTEIR